MERIKGVKRIRDFILEGEAVDGEAILRIRKELEERLVEDMRGKGYVPIIDLLPQLYWDYNKENEKFDFQIVIFGSYVGKTNSSKILGLLDSRPIYFET